MAGSVHLWAGERVAARIAGDGDRYTLMNYGGEGPRAAARRCDVEIVGEHLHARARRQQHEALAQEQQTMSTVVRGEELRRARSSHDPTAAT